MECSQLAGCGPFICGAPLPLEGATDFGRLKANKQAQLSPHGILAPFAPLLCFAAPLVGEALRPPALPKKTNEEKLIWSGRLLFQAISGTRIEQHDQQT